MYPNKPPINPIATDIVIVITDAPKSIGINKPNTEAANNIISNEFLSSIIFNSKFAFLFINFNSKIYNSTHDIDFISFTIDNNYFLVNNCDNKIKEDL